MSQFTKTFNECQNRAHETAKNKGWWNNPRNDGELLALIHTEISECLEALRKGNPPDDKIPQVSGAEAELADAVIRIMDMAQARCWNIAKAIEAKMTFNQTRPHKHGKLY